MTVRLLFVDGPTGSGKDYFMDRLIEELKSKNPSLNIVKWKATDFVLKGPSLTEKRKYVLHDIDEERLSVIYQGHKELIVEATKLLSDKEKAPDLLVVNRSILTTFGTNLWEDKHKERRELLAKDFAEHTKSYLEQANIDSLFIRIDVDTVGLTRGVNTLLQRIASRNDGKEVEVDWLYIILKTYRRDHDLAGMSFTYSDTFNSGEHSLAIKRYFKSLVSEFR